MRAIHVTAIGGPEVLKAVEVPEPEVAPGTLRVRNRAIGINFHDVQSRRRGARGQTHPFIPGTDFAGEVDAVGEGVEGFAEGDRVLGINVAGAYAEKSVVPAVLAVPIPERISYEQAAACPVAGLTACFMIRDHGVGEATNVVVHAAAGSVGCFLGGLLAQKTRALHRPGLDGGEGGGRSPCGLSPRDQLPPGRPRRAGPADHSQCRGRRGLRFGGGTRIRAQLRDVPGRRHGRACSAGRRGIRLGRCWTRPSSAVPAISDCAPISSVRFSSRIPSRFAAPMRRSSMAWPAAPSFSPSRRFPWKRAADAHARIEGQQTVGKIVLLPSTS